MYQYCSLDLLSDNSERVRYNYPELQMYARRGKLSDFMNKAAASHWHDDVEFILCQTGYMTYTVNGESFVVGEGEGLFVNSRQIHHGFSGDGTDCEFLCVLYHPAIICINSRVEQTCVTPVVRNKSYPYLITRGDTPWQSELNTDVVSLYEAANSSLASDSLNIISLVFRMWRLLLEHAPDSGARPAKADSRLSTMREMLGFIQRNYTSAIALDNIAQAGNISKSGCCALFREFLSQTPIQYLTDYRLGKAAERLCDPNATVTDIALSCGFNSSSYFAETFRKRFGCSPTEYRDEKER
jgi:AraC-like DNA-binding protein